MMVGLVSRIPVPFLYDTKRLLIIKVLLAPAGSYFLSSVWSLPIDRVLSESERKELVTHPGWAPIYLSPVTRTEAKSPERAD